MALRLNKIYIVSSLVGKRKKRTALKFNRQQNLQVCPTEFSNLNETVIDIRFPHDVKEFCSLESPVKMYLVGKYQTTLIGAMITPVFFRPTIWEGIYLDFGELSDVKVEFRGA